MIGGILGLGLGDAAAWQFGGLSPKEAHAPVQNHFEVNKRSTWLHGALTAWTVIQIDSMLYRPRGLSYSDDLALRNHLLVAPKNGTALRGNAPAAKNILRQTWKNLNQGDDTKLVGETEPKQTSLLPCSPGLLPLKMRLSKLLRQSWSRECWSVDTPEHLAQWLFM